MRVSAVAVGLEPHRGMLRQMNAADSEAWQSGSSADGILCNREARSEIGRFG